jgi:Holliday junction resolvase RusA-like endonuclease
MTPEGKAWKADAARAFASSGVRFPEKAKVVVEVTAFWPDARGRDMNNLAKITCDALQESGVVVNDKRILWREVDFEIDRANPRLQLDIYALDEGDKRGKA